MRPPPPGWPRISTALYYQDANHAIDWLVRAFGFELKIKIEGEGGRVEHSQLSYGEGLIMVGEANKRERFPWRRSPRQVEGINTQSMMIYVDDVEAHLRQARAAGARISMELQDFDYGAAFWTDRGYEAVDLDGHHWWFYQRLHTGPSQHA